MQIVRYWGVPPCACASQQQQCQQRWQYEGESNENLKIIYLNIYKYLRFSFDSPSQQQQQEQQQTIVIKLSNDKTNPVELMENLLILIPRTLLLIFFIYYLTTASVARITDEGMSTGHQQNDTDRKNRSIRKRPCPSAILSTTNPK